MTSQGAENLVAQLTNRSSHGVASQYEYAHNVYYVKLALWDAAFLVGYLWFCLLCPV